MLNQYGLMLIKSFEGCKLVAYQDSKGIWTIAWGLTKYPDGTPVKVGDTCTQEQADAWFADQVVSKGSHFLDAWVKVKLNDDQYSALTSFIYNVGCVGFKRAVLPFVNTANFSKAITAMYAFDDNGNKGLVRRRKAEVALFTSNYINMEAALKG